MDVEHYWLVRKHRRMPKWVREKIRKVQDWILFPKHRQMAWGDVLFAEVIPRNFQWKSSLRIPAMSHYSLGHYVVYNPRLSMQNPIEFDIACLSVALTNDVDHVSQHYQYCTVQDYERVYFSLHREDHKRTENVDRVEDHCENACRTEFGRLYVIDE